MAGTPTISISVLTTGLGDTPNLSHSFIQSTYGRPYHRIGTVENTSVNFSLGGSLNGIYVRNMSADVADPVSGALFVHIGSYMSVTSLTETDSGQLALLQGDAMCVRPFSGISAVRLAALSGVQYEFFAWGV